MKKLILLAMLALMFSCSRKSVPQLPPVVNNTTVQDKLTPMALAPDSSYVQMLLACDSLNQVYLKEITEYKGKRVETSISLKNNELQYKTKFIRDTIYLPSRDSIVVRTVPVAVATPVYINELSWWQEFLMWAGAAMLLYIAYRVTKLVIKLKR